MGGIEDDGKLAMRDKTCVASKDIKYYLTFRLNIV